MNKKILKVSFPEKCIGCELCVLAAQRQVGKASFEGSPIRIMGGKKGYDIHLDPSVNDLDVNKISEICPKGCFSVEEGGQEEGLEFKAEEDV
ncbi:hypothetical protein A2716_05090 [candidate division WWE3 bacterium RIFCSPHIGHO2_01_FULL_40_23]|uniref:4Fe-4S ferredoxin-type domain-containing protein n=1 Tax=candidate division WWE3 bacterium RIFCSPLOWO2_01_FULL_41_18 TaxID=1802625 RepID=A0A1F4VD94_UNCKA|nr:MAG: hypothetical protein A2716_05090 [candidate division WWE3 bacterium RIFCSPHIGHO2_01_FULL_40_23]OGC55246.1 MAG: hypothetical protein A3A78_04700 [candidate division WWE3 bacterium RIFCSPLOWO2_01_FULL_41_18]